MQIRWFDKQFNKRLYSDVDKRLEKSTKGFAEFIKGRMGSPGYPNIVSGRLYRSIDNAKTGDLSWGVGTDVPYAKALEYGTYKMAPKPFFRNSLNIFKHKIIKYFKG